MTCKESPSRRRKAGEGDDRGNWQEVGRRKAESLKTNAPDDEAYLAPELVAGDAGDGSADSEVNHELGLVG